MLSFALLSILNVAACKVSKHGIDFTVILRYIRQQANTLNDNYL